MHSHKVTHTNTQNTTHAPSTPPSPRPRHTHAQDGSSGAPGWWFGVQTKDGDGALVQPILAWGYEGECWTIFNACYDWTDESWNPSDESFTVQPGDVITSSVTYVEKDNSYDMYVGSDFLCTPLTTQLPPPPPSPHCDLLPCVVLSNVTPVLPSAGTLPARTWGGASRPTTSWSPGRRRTSPRPTLW